MRGVVVFLVCLAGRLAIAEPTAPAPVQSQDARIVSGWEAREGQFPYMLYIRGVSQFGSIYFCGGSIIHPRWGLSSGRCTASRVYLIITGGMVALSRPRFTIETSTVHTAPGFADALHQITQPNDLALVGFNQDLAFDAFVGAVRLQPSADARRDYAGVLMTTSGWGTTWTNGDSVENLNWVHLRGVTNFMCLLMHNSNWLVQETTICAGPYNVTSQGICSGDSGVPLVTSEIYGVPTQLGVGSFAASWGCHVGIAGGFTRVGFYHDFYRQTTGINFDWDPTRDGADSDPIKMASMGIKEEIKIASQ